MKDGDGCAEFVACTDVTFHARGRRAATEYAWLDGAPISLSMDAEAGARAASEAVNYFTRLAEQSQSDDT